MDIISIVESRGLDDPDHPIEIETLTENIPTTLHPEEVQWREVAGHGVHLGDQFSHQRVGSPPAVWPQRTDLQRSQRTVGGARAPGLSCLDTLR